MHWQTHVVGNHESVLNIIVFSVVLLLSCIVVFSVVSPIFLFQHILCCEQLQVVIEFFLLLRLDWCCVCRF
jgi:hypothetical protein